MPAWVALCHCCAVYCCNFAFFLSCACKGKRIPDPQRPFCNGALPRRPMQFFMVVIHHKVRCPAPCRRVGSIFKMTEINLPAWSFLWAKLVQEFWQLCFFPQI